MNKKAYWLSGQFKQSLDNISNKSGWDAPLDGGSSKRFPVSVNYIGTASTYRPDPFASKIEKKTQERLLKQKVIENDTVFEEALEILSQSETGRHLLEEMTKSGYKIAFDDRRTGAYGAGGLCDPENKMIILRSSKDPYYMALVLAHEAVHSLQNSKEKMFPNSSHKPEAGIRLSFAIEADAYAQQTQVALELAHGNPDGPYNQIKYKEPLKQMEKRFPNIVKATEKAMVKPNALKNGATVAAAFEAFYDNPQLRTFYEDAHTAWSDQYAAHLINPLLKKQRHFSKDVEGAWIKNKLRHNGKLYLNEHTPSLDFMDSKHSGVTKETIASIQKFYKKWKPYDAPPVLKEFGVHMKDAVLWVLGVVSHDGAIIVREKTPPVRPPSNNNFKSPKI